MSRSKTAGSLAMALSLAGCAPAAAPVVTSATPPPSGAATAAAISTPVASASAAPVPQDEPVLAAMLADPSQARDIACDLSDRVGPRLSGSPGYDRAVAWGVAEMKTLGLSNVHTEPVMVPSWERLEEKAWLVGDGIDEPLEVTALGGSVSTPPHGIEAEVLEVPSLEALAKMPADAAKGKIVFFNKAMTRGRDGFASYGDTVDIRWAGASEAAKHGAVASVIRSVGTSESRFPHTGVMRYADGVKKIPTGALAVPDAETLSRLLHAGAKVKLKLVLRTKDRGDVKSKEVVGEIPGREKPDEVVLIGGHLDAWDLGRGGVDDAAGVGLALEIARVLKTHPPRRTVRVILFANEENGLKGARAYAVAHAAELAKHQAVLELDAGAGRAFGLRWTAANDAAPLFDSLGARLKPLGVESTRSDAEAGGADTIPIRAAGVPSLEFEQDGTRYFDVHHTADDTCDKIVPEEIAQVRDAALITVWRLAESPALLDRAPVPPPHPG